MTPTAVSTMAGTGEVVRAMITPPRRPPLMEVMSMDRPRYARYSIEREARHSRARSLTMPWLEGEAGVSVTSNSPFIMATVFFAR